jgi:hypothetical protein
MVVVIVVFCLFFCLVGLFIGVVGGLGFCGRMISVWAMLVPDCIVLFIDDIFGSY